MPSLFSSPRLWAASDILAYNLLRVGMLDLAFVQAEYRIRSRSRARALFEFRMLHSEGSSVFFQVLVCCYTSWLRSPGYERYPGLYRSRELLQTTVSYD